MVHSSLLIIGAEFLKAWDTEQALDKTLTRGQQETDWASQKTLWAETENLLHVSPPCAFPTLFPAALPAQLKNIPI